MRLANRKLLFVFSLLTLFLVNCSLYAQVRPPVSDPLSVRASSRIAVEIDDGALRILPGNHHPLARPEFDAGAVPAELPMQSMVLVLQPSEAQAAALDALLEAQQNPASPYFRQWLTPDEFGEHFGASTEDAQRIVSWLESHGMRIEEASPSRRTITFSGSAAQVERTFATTMRRYRVDGALHIANATDPSIPAALAPVVKGLLSLHDFPVQAMHFSATTPAPQMTYGNAHYVTPGDLAAIYDVNPLYTQGVDGSGESIAVVGRSNINLSDVRAFRTTFGLPANDPQVIVNGANPGTANADELVEATLDAEYAGALARQSTVKFVASASTSASDGSFLSAQYIVNQNLAPVMTMSFGLCEAALGAAGNAYINALWQQAAAQGITVLVSAGDSGAAGCDSPTSTQTVYGLAVNGLCSTPYDLCIGGTQFNDTANPSLYWSAANAAGTNASALGYIPEAAWNESGASGLWAGGGGSSILYGKPTWQSGKGVPSDGHRDVPDLSLTSAGHDGYLIVMNGQQFVVAGTSAASPSLASIFAMVVQSIGARLGGANAWLYALANQPSSAVAFHDITSGNNTVPGLTGYRAIASYDLASGLGSVDAEALVKHWRDGLASSIQLTLSTNSLTVVPSTSSPISVKVAGSGVNAAVALSTNGLPKGFTAKFSSSSISAPGSGSTSLQVATTSTVASGSYAFNVVATSGSLSSSAVVNVTVAAPTLTFAAAQASVTLLAGATKTLTLTTEANATLNSTVTLKLTGFPAGVTGTFFPSTIAAPGSGSSVLTLMAAKSAPAGSYAVVVTATAGSLTKTVQLTLDLPSLSTSANATSLSVARGASASLALTTKSAGGFSSAVAIAVSGLPSGVTAVLSTPSIAAPGAGTVSIRLTASATATLRAATITITASGGQLVATVPVTVAITPPPAPNRLLNAKLGDVARMN